MPKISIIVPVYQSENRLESLIKAILKQTHDDFELLLCNDGSTDQSADICKKYESLDSRILMLNLEHSGVSCARNAGLKKATGDWITFADSDDIPHACWLAQLYKIRIPDGLSICGYQCINSDDDTIAYGTFSQKPANLILADIKSRQFLTDLFSNRYMYQGYVWNKLFDKAMLDAHHIRFDEDITFNEDRLFIFRYMLCCKAVRYSGIPCYNYYLKPARIKPYDPAQLSEIHAFLRMEELLCQRKLFEARHSLILDAIRGTRLLYESALEINSPDADWLKKLLNYWNTL